MAMIPSRLMKVHILCIAGPTASGKSSRAVEEALTRGGEIISVDSRQIYRGLTIGTEKIPVEEMRGVPHHLIDIRDPQETYSAGDFVSDATRLIREINERGKLPILVGGTHFYFDALLSGLPSGVDANSQLRQELEALPTEELFAQIQEKDTRRATELDPMNRRRLIRALEIIEAKGEELGLEYKIVGEFIRGERDESSLLPTLSAKLWQYARRQKAWLRKLGHLMP